MKRTTAEVFLNKERMRNGNKKIVRFTHHTGITCS